MTPQTIGYIIYFARKRRRVTQDDLAGFFRIAQSAVTAVENSKTKNYTTGQLERLSEALHLDKEFIVDKDLVSYFPVQFRRGISFIQCAIISAHCASLSKENIAILEEALVERNIMKKGERKGYLSSQLIRKSIAHAFGDKLENIFRVKSLREKQLEEEIPPPTDKDYRSDTHRTRRLDFEAIDSIISSREQDAFWRLLEKLGIEINDDIDLIGEFVKASQGIKLVPQGRVMGEIESLVGCIKEGKVWYYEPGDKK